MQSLIIFTVAVVAWRLYTSFSHLSKVPKQVPWLGRSGSFLSYLSDQIRSIWTTPTVINQAYKKYNKNGLVCAIPMPLSRPEILLPRSLIRWMISQNDALLSPIPVQYEVVGVKYSFLNSAVEGDFAVYNVLRSNMNKQLPKLIPVIMEEVATRVDQAFGSGTEWREIDGHSMVRNVVARISAFMIMGNPLCQDEQLLDDLSAFANCVFLSAVVLRFFPPFMHPVVSYVTTILNRIYKQKAVKKLAPYIKEQIDLMEGDIREGKPLPREDMLNWLIADAIRKNEPREGMVDRVCCRVFVAVFAAIETTTLTMSNVLFDICDSDPTKQFWEGLEDEANRMFAASRDGQLDQASVNSLARADSSLKETLRLRTSIKALATQVTAPDGITLSGSNMKLPFGTRLSVSAWGIHHDEEIYPNAATYDAFRFSRPRENGEPTEAESRNLMVSASETYLPFGLGRHSCPGRYFAAVELKLFLAYLASKYDLKLADGQRPKFVSVGHFPIPPVKGKLLIRRKSDKNSTPPLAA